MLAGLFECRANVPVNPGEQGWILPLPTGKLARRRGRGFEIGCPGFRNSTSLALRVSASHCGIAGARNVSESQMSSSNHAEGQSARSSPRNLQTSRGFASSRTNLSQPASRMTLLGPNQLWAADITYVRLICEFVYLAVVLDVFSRKIIGWALGRSLKAQLPLSALEQAIATRRPPPGVIHHSDQGVQYRCREYMQKLRDHQMLPSMSRPANPYDNATCESFCPRTALMRIPD